MTLPETPLFWGLCGGLMGGATDLVLAYSARTGNPLARRRAWLRLALGALFGPVMAEAFAAQLAVAQPFLGARGVAITLGLVAANDPRGLIQLLKSLLFDAIVGLGNRIQSARGGDNDRT